MKFLVHLAVVFFFFSIEVVAFPEMVRHHYVNCSACHVNTAGGGILNAYGRTISYEVLSTWGSEKEARAFYMVDPEKIGTWLNLGGDVRGLQVHEETKQLKRGRYFWMQGNIDIAATVEKATAYFSIGQVNTENQSMRWISPHYSVSYQITDELSVRGGRYVPLYGINLPQHQFLIKQNLTLGPGTDRDSFDVQFNGEKYNFMLGYSRSLTQSAVRDEEKAIHVQAQVTLQDSHKLGVSYWNGQAENYRKQMLGLHGVLGWTEKFYTLAEIDQVLKTTKNNSAETKSLYQLLKLGYEFQKGFHLQLVEEWGRPDTQASSVEIQSLGAGIIWYPRPHFELESLWSRRRTLGATNQSDQFEDFAYLLTHYYF
jgi:hypothetical protein